jgi:hypothetical protein
MVPQSSWPSSTSGYSKNVPTGRHGWWRLVAIIVALGVFPYSSRGLAGDEISGASSRLPQHGEDHALSRTGPTADVTEQDPAIFSHTEPSQGSWTSLIQSLVQSPERSALAADVGELLRQGDLTGARERLEAAIAVGTFAIILSDGIQEPDLQRLLQAMARERQDTRLAQATSGADAGANESKVGELKDAAERERVRAEAALDELHAMQGQLAALREREARVVELEHALEQEKGRNASASQDLSLVREQLSAMIDNATRAAEARDDQAREVEKVKAALSELTGKLAKAQEQLADVRGSTADTAELRATLERERDAVKLAARENESLKRELAMRQTSGVSANGAVSPVSEENERADAASRQLDAVHEQLSALQVNEAKMQDELKQERGRSASATRQLEASQKVILALKAQVASAATTQEALRQEQESSAAALRDVRALKRQISDLDAHTEFTPAALLFQTTPVLLEPSIHTFQSGARPSSGAGTEGKVSQRKARQVSLHPHSATERELSDEGATQTRPRNLPLKSVEEKSVSPPSGRRGSNEVADKDTIIKLKRSPHSRTRENSAPRPFAPNLPPILLPIEGMWALY